MEQELNDREERVFRWRHSRVPARFGERVSGLVWLESELHDGKW